MSLKLSVSLNKFHCNLIAVFELLVTEEKSCVGHSRNTLINRWLELTLQSTRRVWKDFFKRIRTALMCVELLICYRSACKFLTFSPWVSEISIFCGRAAVRPVFIMPEKINYWFPVVSSVLLFSHCLELRWRIGLFADKIQIHEKLSP